MKGGRKCIVCSPKYIVTSLLFALDFRLFGDKLVLQHVVAFLSVSRMYLLHVCIDMNSLLGLIIAMGTLESRLVIALVLCMSVEACLDRKALRTYFAFEFFLAGVGVG